MFQLPRAVGYITLHMPTYQTFRGSDSQPLHAVRLYLEEPTFPYPSSNAQTSYPLQSFSSSSSNNSCSYQLYMSSSGSGTTSPLKLAVLCISKNMKPKQTKRIQCIKTLHSAHETTSDPCYYHPYFVHHPRGGK